MIEFIINKFNGIILKACDRFGKENGVDAEKIQVLFTLDEEGDVKYTIMVDYKPLKEVTFNQILDVKIDFKGYSLIVPQFIQKTIFECAEKHSKNPLELKVICINTGSDVVIYLYHKYEPVEEIKLEEL